MSSKKLSSVYVWIVIIVISIVFTSCSNKSGANNTEGASLAPSIQSDSRSTPKTSIKVEETADVPTPTILPTQKATIKKTMTAVPTQKPTPKPTPTPEPTADTVRIVIPEGFTVTQIAERLEANKVCKKADFLKMVNEYDFSYYPLVSKIDNVSKRAFKLEGYLFPNTYEFYRYMKPQDAIGILLRGAEANIGDKYKYSGMSTDDIITLASIIEDEAGKKSEMAKVSFVFHNRLKSGMKLQADATIFFVEDSIKPNITGDKNRYNELYNTYKTKALPVGPIGNPGKNALNAAVNPADTDYFYFVTDKNGKYYYAVTFEEHLANCEKAGVFDDDDGKNEDGSMIPATD